MRKRKKNKYLALTKNPEIEELADISKAIYKEPIPNDDINEFTNSLYANMKNTVNTHNLVYALKNGTKNIDVLSAAQAVWLEGAYEPRIEANPYEVNPKIYEYDAMKNKDNILVSEINEENMLYAQEILDDYNIPFRELYEYSTNFQNVGHNDVLVKSLNDSPDAQYENQVYNILDSDPYIDADRKRELESNLKQFDNTYEMDVEKLKQFTPLEDCQFTLDESRGRINLLNTMYRKVTHDTAVRANLMYENEPDKISYVIVSPKNLEKYDYIAEMHEEAIADPEDAQYLVYVQVNKDKQPEYRIIDGDFKKTSADNFTFTASTGVNVNIEPNHKQHQLFPAASLRDAERVIQSKMFLDNANLQKKYQNNLLDIYKDFGPKSNKAMKPALHNIQEAMAVIDQNVVKYLENTVEKPLENLIDDPIADTYKTIDDERMY